MGRRGERELRGQGQFQSFGAQSVLRRRQYTPVRLGALEQCLCLVNSARDRVNDITSDLRWHVLCTALGTYHGRDAGHGSVHALALELDTDQAEFGFRPTLMTDSDQSFHLRPFLFRLRRVGVSHSPIVIRGRSSVVIRRSEQDSTLTIKSLHNEQEN